jgi:hypothetical protein
MRGKTEKKVRRKRRERKRIDEKAKKAQRYHGESDEREMRKGLEVRIKIAFNREDSELEVIEKSYRKAKEKRGRKYD